MNMMLSAQMNMENSGQNWANLVYSCTSGDSLTDLNSSEDEQVSDNSSKAAIEEGGNEDADLRSDVDLLKRRISEKRVSFPDDESKLASVLVDPDVEFCSDVDNATSKSLIDIYKACCNKNDTLPLEKVVEQLKTLDLNGPRTASLTLRGLSLGPHDCESLEEVLKHVQLKLLDLGASHSNDDGLIALFDMVEFYEAASHVSIAANRNMTSRGWQACSRMIKKTECLEWLDAAEVSLSEHSSSLLARALRSNSRLRVLHLSGSKLSGRSLTTIANALKLNRNLRELHLAENQLNTNDALQLSMLLTVNNWLQLLDLRNNEIHDKGLTYLCDSLMENSGLTTLIVWNNGITSESSSSLAKVLASNTALRILNLGHNHISNDGLVSIVKGGLERNRHLLNLGLQDCGLSCTGIIALAECLTNGTQLERVDLRKNNIKLAGLLALAVALKMCPTVTRVDLDGNASNENAEEYSRLQAEVSKICAANEASKTEKVIESENAVIGIEGEKPCHSMKEDLVSRKISLTCSVPPRESIVIPIIKTDEDTINEEGEIRSHRKLRSPLPSPSPSPLPSPLQSPSSRFKVTRVENDSPLPSPRSRFTVTPVTELQSSKNHLNCNGDVCSEDCANLIRSCPSKVVVGFEITNDSNGTT